MDHPQLPSRAPRAVSALAAFLIVLTIVLSLGPAGIAPATRAAAATAATAATLPASVTPTPVPIPSSDPSATPSSDPTDVPTDGEGGEEGDDLPLHITIDTLTPSYVPTKGPLEVTGTVTNTDEVPWQRVNVYSVMGTTPLRSEAELAAAVASPENTYIGGRNTTEGQYGSIDVIDPGQSREFTFTLPQSAITVSETGVYWFMVQALGESPEGRLDGADGRARTFLPLVAADAAPVKTALVLPLRREVTYADDGSLTGTESWTASLDIGGRLRALADFGAAAGDHPFTWLLDPALPDAVQHLAEGNAPRSIAATLSPDGDGATASPSPEPDASGAPEASDGGETGGASGAGDGADLTPDEAATAQVATTWLGRLSEALRSREVLSLPYGDVDVAGAAEHDPALLAAAVERSAAADAALGLPVQPVVGSPSGFIDSAGVLATDPATPILVTDQAYADATAFPDGAPAVADAEGHRLVTTSSAAADGGATPGDPYAPVALRQRVLSEVALRTLSTADGQSPDPLVVMLPQQWMPASPSTFFSGLDTPWVDLTTVSDVAATTPAQSVPLDALTYPELQVNRELDAANFSSVADLIAAGDALQSMLPLNDVVGGTVGDQALTSMSYAARLHADAARSSVERSTGAVADIMGEVTIEAPPGVNLSSASGRLPVTVVNNLPEPVRVRIEPTSDRGLRIAQSDPLDIAATSQANVLLTARTQENGVHNVVLALTTAGGAPLGSSDTLPIRSVQVSKVIWIFLGGGVALLFGAIAVRLVRRVRAARRGPRTEASPGAPGPDSAT